MPDDGLPTSPMRGSRGIARSSRVIPAQKMWDCETSANVGLEKVVRAKSRLGGAVPPATNTSRTFLNHNFLECLYHSPLALYERTLNSSTLTGAGYPYVDLQLNFDPSPTSWCFRFTSRPSTTSSVHVSSFFIMCHSLHSEIQPSTWRYRYRRDRPIHRIVHSGGLPQSRSCIDLA